ncbi:phosphatidate cytidylyltransferase [Rhodocaloribacter litoris]|uniref:phosphatidate cytidylyltransferase n=1 Tax=Rhodocaloribacter litoris TaxID=2558931 RepID=UPI00141D79D2|nr:phosphatidate cytidylyltransferase [Rhodocaloribacter litoris]QXD15716.1 phosphatidate cytidylyltransferase [Rhodocaloribacter litoris]GIV60216.1 MAG: phosphatidate cytidylyltransferase [Rhodothermaceae bacterium]
MSNAVLRLLTALIGIPVVVGVLYAGGWWVGGLLLGVALLAQREVYHLMEAGGLSPRKAEGLVLGALLVLWAYVPAAGAAALALVLAGLALSPLRHAEDNPLPSLAATVFGALYPTLFLAFLIRLRLAEGGAVGDREAFWLTLAVVVLVWVTDTLAYYTGKALGRRPLAPRVSPKKTWEGTIGGAAGALAAAVVFKLTVLPFLAWPHLLMVGLLCGVVSQLGDLAESKMKRAAGVKDSGTILPGHGGLLDRLDALILAVPLVYLYLAYVARLYA